MGSATCLMGLLPTYKSIGIGAPVLLVLLRLLQGLGAGAEYGGAALLLAEQRPAHRAFYGSFAASGVFVGLVLSVGVFSMVTTPLSREALLSWGWRNPISAERDRHRCRVLSALSDTRNARIRQGGAGDASRGQGPPADAFPHIQSNFSLP